MALKPQQPKKGVRKSKRMLKKEINKKQSYNLLTPFTTKPIGQTVLNKQNTEIVAEKKLKGRVFEMYQQDMEYSSAVPRKVSFLIKSLRGTDCHSLFNGLTITTDKHKSIIRKWHTLIETYTDVITNENIKLRVFLICTSKRTTEKRHAYLKNTIRKDVRKGMIQTVLQHMNGLKINDLVKLVMSDKMDKLLEEHSVTQIMNCHVRKIKVIKRPREIMEQAQ